MLSGPLLNIIEHHDQPIVTGYRRDASVLRTPSEADATCYRAGGKSYYFKRFFDLGKTRRYVLDVVSGRTWPISALEWDLLDDLLLYDDEEHVTRHPDHERDTVTVSVHRLKSILTPHSDIKLCLPDVPRYDEAIQSGMIRTLALNTTERCNLRCTYCYYGGGYSDTRVHNDSKLTETTLRDCITAFLDNHEKTQGATRAIYFFGGEPLLNFSMIEEGVLFAKSLARNRGIDLSNLIFQVATNGMPLTNRNVAFLVEHGVYMNISIDGPNHDRYRVDRRGMPTLNRVMAKIEWLWINYPEYFAAHVGLNCVVTPPYNIAALFDFFTTFKPAGDALQLDLDLVLPGGGDLDFAEATRELTEAKKQLWSLFVRSHGLTTEERNRSWIHFFTTGFNFLHLAFWRVLWRPKMVLRRTLDSIVGANSLPGLYISTVGTDGAVYATYEYQHDGTRIGDVRSGLRAERMYELAENFRAACQAGACQSCWAARMCNLDYPDFMICGDEAAESARQKVESKMVRCQQIREDLATALAATETIRQEHGNEAFEPYRAEKQELARSEGICWFPMETPSDELKERMRSAEVRGVI